MNMKTLLSTLNREEVMLQIKNAGIYEYGMVREELSEKIEAIIRLHKADHEQVMAAGALNNNDFFHMYLNVLRDNTDKVLTGLGVVAWLIDAEEMIVYLPEEETELSHIVLESARKLEMDIKVENAIVNTRLMKNGIINHFQTLAAVADVLNGQYEPGVLVSVVKYATSKSCETVVEPHCISYGTRLAEVIGNLDGVKAVQVGDELYCTKEIADVQITEKTVLGDGVIKLYMEDCCMVDAALLQLLESRKKSCGKCTFCREGLIQLYTRMKEIVSKKGELASLEIMKEIGSAMTSSCCCTIGSSGSAFVLDTLEKFFDEYIDHVKRKKCTAGSCLAFKNIYIDPQKCTGCGICVDACETNCIEGIEGYIHMKEDVDCTKCEQCKKVCPEEAIISTTSSYVPRLPDRLTKVGRFKRY